MKLAAICCTYRRPRELATAIECFLRQDHNDREMVVLDDAGQLAADALNGLPGVTLVTSPVRFRTLGEKRNASAALVSPDVEAYCVWDDDDIYLPWHMSAAAAALKDADYSIPTQIFVENTGRLEHKANQCLFHGAWAFRRAAFDRVHGYPFIQSGQDQGFLKRLKEANSRWADPISFEPRPSYVYRWFTTSCRWHLSAMGNGGYERLAAGGKPSHVNKIEPHWEKEWLRMTDEGMRCAVE